MSPRGHTLVEVVVALCVLEVSLLGTTGMLLLASAELARATLIEQGAAEAAQVADSLSRLAERPAGSVQREEWRVSWEPEGEMTRVWAAPLRGGEPVVEILVP